LKFAAIAALFFVVACSPTSTNAPMTSQSMIIEKAREFGRGLGTAGFNVTEENAQNYVNEALKFCKNVKNNNAKLVAMDIAVRNSLSLEKATEFMGISTKSFCPEVSTKVKSDFLGK